MIVGMNTRTALAWILVVLVVASVSAEETEVLFDGSQIRDWTTQRDQDRLSREFRQRGDGGIVATGPHMAVHFEGGAIQRPLFDEADIPAIPVDSRAGSKRRRTFSVLGQGA
jgi:hypothetical protein